MSFLLLGQHVYYNVTAECEILSAMTSLICITFALPLVSFILTLKSKNHFHVLILLKAIVLHVMLKEKNRCFCSKKYLFRYNLLVLLKYFLFWLMSSVPSDHVI